MSAFNGNAWMSTTGQPLPASRYRTVRQLINARDSRTITPIIAVIRQGAFSQIPWLVTVARVTS